MAGNSLERIECVAWRVWWRSEFFSKSNPSNFSSRNSPPSRSNFSKTPYIFNVFKIVGKNEKIKNNSLHFVVHSADSPMLFFFLYFNVYHPPDCWLQRVVCISWILVNVQLRTELIRSIFVTRIQRYFENSPSVFARDSDRDSVR